MSSAKEYSIPHMRRELEIPLDADTKLTVAPIRKKPRPAERAAQARANNRSGAISREQAAVYLGVGYSTLEKLAARGEGPFCFRVGALVRYPVDALEAWKLANDARQSPVPPMHDAP